ncbi:MAG: hypothetical protein QMB63_04145 [Clostridiaceae bacterium]
MTIKNIALIIIIEIAVFALARSFTSIPIYLIYLIIGFFYMFWFVSSEGGLFNRILPPKKDSKGNPIDTNKKTPDVNAPDLFYQKLAIGLPFVLLPFIWDYIVK